MWRTRNNAVAVIALSLLPVLSLARGAAAAPARETHVLRGADLAARAFGNDAPWYRRNIPFFACSDPEIEQIYYYRWKLFKSHLRDIGDRGYIVTEFLDDVGWSLKPFEILNDVTSFHVHEGRWLRDPRYARQYLDVMYHGGNDRHFSEAIADAAYGEYLVHGDRAAALQNLEAMKRIYRQWDDHLDRSKGLYFIEPLLDATEYTISSIDAADGKEGFRGGDAFRPSINSFMYANARAISRLSALAGDAQSAKEYADRAATLRDLVQKQLWNDEFQHFIDRYKVDNRYVHYWEFIRGRELAGYTPWYFELPDKDPRYLASWEHLLSPIRLGGRYGLRTVEPSYPYYQKQYRYAMEDGARKPECQWNGPSWPFQTTLALGGLANLLNDYPQQQVVSAADYVRLLRQYAHQHYQNGQPDLQEDYNPDTGRVIVGLQRSHHYNHSGYNDLIITGLVGLRPRSDEMLEVNPLIPSDPKADPPITYFCLENAPYHGRLVTVLYDRDGSHYHRGTGLSVYVDGRQVVKGAALGRKVVPLPKTEETDTPPPALANLAVNVHRAGYPTPAASANSNPKELHAAVDGRVWFYPEVRNYWTNAGSSSASDWYSIDLGQPETVNTVQLYFYADGHQFAAPSAARIEYWDGGQWLPAPHAGASPAKPLANGETTITFSPVQTSRLRAVFTNPRHGAVALVELKAFGLKTVAARPLLDTSHGAGLPLELPGLETENSRTGEFHGVQWRDAANGGYFAFDLPVEADRSSALVVTYWGGDVGNRRFDVLVDGVRIGEQTLENNRPGEFFDVTYSIPEALTRGKSRVKVRFQAKPGAVAGGVFGVHLARRMR